jgi:hypothetical protein
VKTRDKPCFSSTAQIKTGIFLSKLFVGLSKQLKLIEKIEGSEKKLEYERVWNRKSGKFVELYTSWLQL